VTSSPGSDDRPDDGRSSDAERQRHAAEVISHHLRTPLTIVRSGLALLEDSSGRLSLRERREVMEDVRQETERLVQVVDDVLAILTPTGTALRVEPVLLQRLLPATFEAAAGMDARLRIDHDLDEGLPPVCGDPERISHVTRNLIAAAAAADSTRTIHVVARVRGPWMDVAIRAASGAVAALPPAKGGDELAIRSARRIAIAMAGRVIMRRAGGELTLRLPVAGEGC
jgi:signal transduction histidine kinase